MSLEALVDQLVEERSLDALERLTGSRSEEVLDALIDAAGRIIAAERADPSDDEIVEELRQHLIEARAVGLLVDHLQDALLETREFALSCLSEIGDMKAFQPMVAMLEDGDAGIREAAAANLALLTTYDFGQDARKWREWADRRQKGLEEQKLEDQEDKARRLRLRLGVSTKRGGGEDDGTGDLDR